jgi:hypothetical protein
MGDQALKQLQIGLEGGYTSAAASTYNGGTAVAATRRLAVDKSVMADLALVYQTPEESRGTYAGVYNHILQLVNGNGKIPSAVYADDMIFFLKMFLSGAPTVTTLPTAPTALLAATAIASTLSLTTQPNAAADGALSKILAVTLSNSVTTATPVNITITGTDVSGNALIESVNFTAGTATPSTVGGGAGAITCTLYTKNYFKTVGVAGVACSASPSGDLVAIGGVNAFLWTFNGDMGTSTLQSATGEYFDGTASWQLPGMVIEKGGITADIGKSLKIDATFLCRNKVALAAAAGSINPVAQLGTHDTLTNLVDTVFPAIPTWMTRFYADPIGTTPGTTKIDARLTNMVYTADMAVKLGKAADGTPYPNFVSRDHYGAKTNNKFTLLFNNYSGTTVDPVEYVAYMTYASRTICAAFPGVLLPCGTLSAIGNWPTQLADASGKGGYYGMMLNMAGKYTVGAEKAVENRAAFEFTLDAEVDLVSMNSPLQAIVVSRLNPNS